MFEGIHKTEFVIYVILIHFVSNSFIFIGRSVIYSFIRIKNIFNVLVCSRIYANEDRKSKYFITFHLAIYYIVT